MTSPGALPSGLVDRIRDDLVHLFVDESYGAEDGVVLQSAEILDGHHLAIRFLRPGVEGTLGLRRDIEAMYEGFSRPADGRLTSILAHELLEPVDVSAAREVDGVLWFGDVG
ncbi:MAG: hypothetical protein H7Y15_08300 [Pseudonocardia sp.]|nr:hypothetical protein [Pseudonocardia sp.]